MNEKVVRELMKESLLRTSEDFTENLMERVEGKPVTYDLSAKVKILLGASLMVLLVVPLIWFRLAATDGNFTFHFFIPFILFVSILINRYMRLNEAQQTV